jgi:hypothetical protein
MFISAKVYFDNHIDTNVQLLRRAETALPDEFVRLYKKNVVAITPRKSGALRRSIITQSLGNTANISWRVPYAKAQDDGGHTQSHTVRGINQRDGGGGTIMPGSYRYRNYTTPGTGPHFATIAFKATTAQMPAVYRQLGLTQ